MKKLARLQPRYFWSAIVLVLIALGVHSSELPPPPINPSLPVASLRPPLDAVHPNELTAEEQSSMLQEAMANLWRIRSVYNTPIAGVRESSAQNGRIAFIGRDQNLYLVDPDGKNEQPVTTGLQETGAPGWSHDGVHIAFVAANESGSQHCLYKLHVSSGAIQELSCFNDVTFPRWSPDDAHIVVFGERGNPAGWRAWVVPASGGSAVALAPGLNQNWSPAWIDAQTVVLPAETAPDIWKLHRVNIGQPAAATPITPEFRCGSDCDCGQGDAWLIFPDVAPNGSDVAFMGGYTVSNKTSCVAYYALYLVDPNGNSQPRKIADLADTSSGTASGGMVLWGPGSQKVAAYAGGSDNITRMNLVDTTNGQLTSLQEKGGTGWGFFDWSPDGRQLSAGYALPEEPYILYMVDPAASPVFQPVAQGSDSTWIERQFDEVDLRITGLEITQAIQNLANEVPSVAGKRTWVRVYARSAQGDVENASARLTLTRDNESTTLVPVKNPITVYADGGQRANPDHSFNFLLPLDWSKGEIQMRAQLFPPASALDTNLSDNLYPQSEQSAISRTFAERRSYKVASWRFSITSGGNTYSVTEGEAESTMNYVRTTYPVAVDAIDIDDRGKISVNRGTMGWSDFLISLSREIASRCPDVRSADVDVLACYGWVPNGLYSAGYMGYAPGNYAIAGLANYGRIASHEIGHILGRSHAVGCGALKPFDGDLTNSGLLQEIGFSGDQTNQTTYSGPGGYYDFMSYCGVNSGQQWVTKHTFEALYNALPPQETVDTTERDLPVETLQNQSYMVVSALLSSQGGVEFYPVYAVERPVGWDDQSGTSSYRLEFRDQSNVVKFTRYFEPNRDVPGQTVDSMLIYEEIPVVPNLSAIVLFNGNSELGRIVVSGHAPQVSLLYPLAGLEVSGTIPIAWSASDQDNDSLSYLVEFSPDGGSSWRVLAIDHQSLQLEVDTSSWPQTTQGQIRVTVSDGANVASATSPLFSVTAKVPTALILSPQADQSLSPELGFDLIGKAQDPEDGVLSGTSLIWYIDGNQVGSGRTVSVDPLPLGKHTIVLESTDSNGNRTIDSIEIASGLWLDDLYLPTIQSGK